MVRCGCSNTYHVQRRGLEQHLHRRQAGVPEDRAIQAKPDKYRQENACTFICVDFKLAICAFVSFFYFSVLFVQKEGRKSVLT
jgi:hypothetical protein